jgi:hypothetical protein
MDPSMITPMALAVWGRFDPLGCGNVRDIAVGLTPADGPVELGLLYLRP